MNAKGLATTILAVLLLWWIVASEADNGQTAVPDNTIYGHVFDAQTKKPLPSALLYCLTCAPSMTDRAV